MIKRFAELDENNIVKAIRNYLTDDGWSAPDFLIVLTDPLITPDIGTVYKDVAFVNKSVAVKDLQKKLFDPLRNKLFAETQWVRERAADLKEFDRLGVRTLTTADITSWKEWLVYWKALRDLPSQVGFDPQNPVFPEQPK